jgi:hypothetical protein
MSSCCVERRSAVSNIHHLERSLRKLRLTRVGAEWHALEKRALAEVDPSRYLLTLCNEELLWRESEKLRRYKGSPVAGRENPG